MYSWPEIGSCPGIVRNQIWMEQRELTMVGYPYLTERIKGIIRYVIIGSATIPCGTSCRSWSLWDISSWSCFIDLILTQFIFPLIHIGVVVSCRRSTVWGHCKLIPKDWINVSIVQSTIDVHMGLTPTILTSCLTFSSLFGHPEITYSSLSLPCLDVNACVNLSLTMDASLRSKSL